MFSLSLFLWTSVFSVHVVKRKTLTDLLLSKVAVRTGFLNQSDSHNASHWVLEGTRKQDVPGVSCVAAV